MREVVIQKWCDGEHVDYVEAVMEHTISIDGGKPLLLDLCKECDDRLVVPLLGLLADAPLADSPALRGRSVKATGQEEKQRTCPDCGYICKTRGALGQHVKRHGKGLRDYDW